MLGQSVIPKQIEIIKSKYRFLQVKTYSIWDKFQIHVTILNLHPSYIAALATGLCLGKRVGKLYRGPDCGSALKATNEGLRGEC